jgi:hypothetical protein
MVIEASKGSAEDETFAYEFLMELWERSFDDLDEHLLGQKT